MNTKYDEELILNVFKARNDCCGSGEGKCIRKKVDTFLLIKHLAGKERIGLYTTIPEKNTVWWSVVDIDIEFHDINTAIKFIRICRDEFKLSSHLEISKSGGGHVWFFYDKDIPAWKVRRIFQFILLSRMNLRVANSNSTEAVEVFPKQDIPPDVGNYVNLPFYGEDVSKGRTLFVDYENGLIPFPDQMYYLRNIKKVTEEDLNKLISKYNIDSTMQAFERKSTPFTEETSKNIKEKREKLLSCAKKVLEQGVDHGQRDNVTFALAKHLKKAGYTEEEAELELMEWDSKNRPPLAEYIIRDKIKQAEKYDSLDCENIMSAWCDKEKCPVLKQKKSIYKSFHRTSDGIIAEMVYSKELSPNIQFAVYNPTTDKVEYKPYIEDENKLIYPYEDETIEEKAILLPSRASVYESTAKLVERIRAFIHRYVELDPLFERISVYYGLFSWVYDLFDVVPYIHIIADVGTAKSRYLKTIGSICYKPIFCAGALTSAPIFRFIEKYKGSFIVDDLDLKDSELTSDIIKILNCGFMQGLPILRCVGQGTNQEPKAFNAFGIKIIASRDEMQDTAFESRCLKYWMKPRTRDDIPLNLPMKEFEEEALNIRNQLLMWRFKNYKQVKLKTIFDNNSIEDRLNQIMSPLASVIDDPELIKDFKKFIKEYNREIIIDRGMSFEAEVVEEMYKLHLEKIESKSPEYEFKLYMQEIANRLNAKHSAGKESGDWKNPITAKRLGGISKKLKLKKNSDRNGYYIDFKENQPIEALLIKYGINLRNEEER